MKKVRDSDRIAPLILTVDHSSHGSIQVRRIRTPGGWLVITSWETTVSNGSVGTVSSTYVPDPNYEWKPENDVASGGLNGRE